MEAEKRYEEEWDDDVLRRGGGFLQSWVWGEFQRAAGFGVARFRDENGLGQFFRRALPFRNEYWYCPRGPIGAGIIESLPYRSELRRAAFVRYEPARAEITGGPAGVVKVRDVQPSRTSILDLTKTPDELLAAMHEKTRYNIRLAERKGVRVYAASGKDENAFTRFAELLAETTGREGFHAHDADYYRLMLETMRGGYVEAKSYAVARLMLAEHDGNVLAASLVVAFGDTVTYLHGASSRTRREVMAPYLLHWKTILEAKEAGFKTYDFWGVAPEGAGESHPWAGFSRFKRGFGGSEIAYPGTYDLPMKKGLYRLYSLARRLRGR